MFIRAALGILTGACAICIYGLVCYAIYKAKIRVAKKKADYYEDNFTGPAIIVFILLGGAVAVFTSIMNFLKNPHDLEAALFVLGAPIFILGILSVNYLAWKKAEKEEAHDQ